MSPFKCEELSGSQINRARGTLLRKNQTRTNCPPKGNQVLIWNIRALTDIA